MRTPTWAILLAATIGAVDAGKPSSGITTITPCAAAPSSKAPPLITVTSQYQPISTCDAQVSCVQNRCRTKYSYSTWDFVSTVIPCPYNSPSPVTTVTKTDQSVLVSRASKTITNTEVTTTVLSTKWRKPTTITSTTSSYTTIIKEWSALYKDLGELAIPDYGGCGICKKCRGPHGEKVQNLEVVECVHKPVGPVVCRKVPEVWIFDNKPTSSSTASAVCSTRTAVPSAGTYVFKFPQRCPPATINIPGRIMTYPQGDKTITTTVTASKTIIPGKEWTATVTRSCARPTIIEFRVVVTKIIIIVVPPFTYPHGKPTQIPPPANWGDWTKITTSTVSPPTTTGLTTSSGTVGPTFITTTSSGATWSTGTSSGSAGPATASTTSTGTVSTVSFSSLPSTATGSTISFSSLWSTATGSTVSFSSLSSLSSTGGTSLGPVTAGTTSTSATVSISSSESLSSLGSSSVSGTVTISFTSSSGSLSSISETSSVSTSETSSVMTSPSGSSSTTATTETVSVSTSASSTSSELSSESSVSTTTSESSTSVSSTTSSSATAEPTRFLLQTVPRLAGSKHRRQVTGQTYVGFDSNNFGIQTSDLSSAAVFIIGADNQVTADGMLTGSESSTVDSALIRSFSPIPGFDQWSFPLGVGMLEGSDGFCLVNDVIFVALDISVCEQPINLIRSLIPPIPSSSSSISSTAAETTTESTTTETTTTSGESTTKATSTETTLTGESTSSGEFTSSEATSTAEESSTTEKPTTTGESTSSGDFTSSDATSTAEESSTTEEPTTTGEFTTSEEPTTSEATSTAGESSTTQEPTSTGASTTTSEEPTSSEATSTAEEPTTTGESTTMAESTTSGESSSSEATSTAGESSTTEDSTTIGASTSSEEPTSSEATSTAEEPTTTRESTTSEEPTSSEATSTAEESTTAAEPTSSEGTSTAEESTTAAEPTSSEGTSTAEEPTTTAESTSSEATSTAEESTTTAESTSSEGTSTAEEYTTTAESTTSEATSTAEESTTAAESTTTDEITTSTESPTPTPTPTPAGTCSDQTDPFTLSNGDQSTKLCSSNLVGGTPLGSLGGATSYLTCADACASSTSCDGYVWDRTMRQCFAFSGPFAMPESNSDMDSGILVRTPTSNCAIQPDPFTLSNNRQSTRLCGSKLSGGVLINTVLDFNNYLPCAEACASADSCRAFQWSQNLNQCSLFSGSPTAEPDSDYDSGIVTLTSNCAIQPDPFTLSNDRQSSRLCGSSLTGGSSAGAVTGLADYLACAEVCASSETCTAFAWDKSYSVCLTYAGSPTPVPDADFDSGILANQPTTNCASQPDPFTLTNGVDSIRLCDSELTGGTSLGVMAANDYLGCAEQCSTLGSCDGFSWSTSLTECRAYGGSSLTPVANSDLSSGLMLRPVPKDCASQPEPFLINGGAASVNKLCGMSVGATLSMPPPRGITTYFDCAEACASISGGQCTFFRWIAGNSAPCQLYSGTPGATFVDASVDSGILSYVSSETS